MLGVRNNVLGLLAAGREEEAGLVNADIIRACDRHQDGAAEPLFHQDDRSGTVVIVRIGRPRNEAKEFSHAVINMAEIIHEVGWRFPRAHCIIMQWSNGSKVVESSSVGHSLFGMPRSLLSAPELASRAAVRCGWKVAGMYYQYPSSAKAKYFVPWHAPCMPWRRRLGLWHSVIALARGSGLRRRLLRMISIAAGLRLFRRFAPAFVLVLTKSLSGGRNAIEEACFRTFGKPRPWAVMMVRPMNVCVVPVYNSQDRTFDYLRIALDRRAANGIRRHARICRGVHDFDLPFKVPHQVSSGHLAGGYFQIESQLEGVDGRRSPHRVPDMCAQAVQALVRVFKATCGPFSERIIRRWVRRMAFVRRLDIPGTRPSVAFFEEVITSIASTMKFACMAHNDYHLGNILFGQQGRLVGVIDWDLADRWGMPGGDLSVLLVNMQITALGQSFRAAVRALLSGSLGPGEDFVTRYFQGTGLYPDRRLLVLGYLIVNAWRKAYLMHGQHVEAGSDQFMFLASQITLSCSLMEEIYAKGSIAKCT